ncbi:MAG: hypothetical protein Q7S73_01640 [bacterium]|nr:hypothetical protein [bacterium]
MKRSQLLLAIIFFFASSPISFAKTDEQTPANFNGSFALNFRINGPENQRNEFIIQNPIWIIAFFGWNWQYPAFDIGPTHWENKIFAEFKIPPPENGHIVLYQLYSQLTYENYEIKIGKFLVPFGYYNSLYKPDQFLTLTRPDIYADPSDLDFISHRLNGPRAILTPGYSDTGLNLSYNSESDKIYIPKILSIYVVNGLGEISDRSRTFPNSQMPGIPPPPIGGVDLDFGNTKNRLASHFNQKAFGGRMEFLLGDFKFSHPISEKKRIKLTGISLGLSGMHSGTYSLEPGLPYTILGTDLSFRYRRLSFTGEYVYGENKFRHAQADADGEIDFLQNTEQLPTKLEINRGLYLQGAFPIRKQLLGIVSFGRLERRGPEMMFSSNTRHLAFAPSNKRINTSVNKYTFGLNYALTEDFDIKWEFSYWKINLPVPNVYQWGVSFVRSF